LLVYSYDREPEKLDPWLCVAGILLTVATVFFAASFRSLRRRVHEDFSKEELEFVRPTPLFRQWWVHVSIFIGILVLWLRLLDRQYQDASPWWILLGAVLAALMVYLGFRANEVPKSKHGSESGSKERTKGQGTMDETQKEYRQGLLELEQKAQEQYDRTVVYLSGGALGVSFAFVENFIKEGAQSKAYLLTAWGSWGLSVTCALASFYFSALALRQTVEALDAGKKWPDARSWHDTATAVLNAASGLLFLLGVIMLTVFVWLNL